MLEAEHFKLQIIMCDKVLFGLSRIYGELGTNNTHNATFVGWLTFQHNVLSKFYSLLTFARKQVI